MNTAIPLIAIALAVASLALSSPPATKSPAFNPFGAIIAILVASIAGFVWRNDYPNLLPAALGFSGAIAVCFLCRIVDGFRATSVAAAFGLAAGLAGVLRWITVPNMEMLQLAVIAGLSIGAWLCGDFRPGRMSLSVWLAIVSALVLAADFMGQKYLNNEPGGSTGAMMGLAAAIAALVGQLMNRSEKRADPVLGFVPSMIAVGILLILGFVVGSRLVENTEAWMIFSGSVLAATILNWVIRPDGKDDTFTFLVATVIWIGIATLAFSHLKGYGMTIAATGAILTFAIFGNVRAMLSVGPLIGLAFYRVLRESHLDAVRALDIGQHYAVIGLGFGLVAALLPSEWITKRGTGSMQTSLGRLLWTIVLCLLPVAMSVVLGAKGMVGFVAGLGFASLIEGLRNGSNALPILFTGGLAALIAVSYDWLAKLLDLTRESKQIAFYWIAGVALALGVLISLVSKPAEEPQAELS